MRTIVTYESSHGTAEKLARIIAERLDAVCGYVHEGTEPPEKCPLCGVAGGRFVIQE